MDRKNFIDLPFKSVIEKYDYYLEGKINFILCEFTNPSFKYRKMKVFKNGRVVINKPNTYDLLIWNLETRKVDITLSGHTKSIISIKILNDNRIISFSYDGSIKIWNSYTGQCEYTLKASRFTSMMISENNHIITLEKLNNMDIIKVWDPDTGICELEISNNKMLITIITLNDKLMFTLEDFYNSIHEIKIWDLNSKTYIQTITYPENYITKLMKFDENRIFREFSDNTFRFWNVITGECEIIKKENSSDLYPCLILPDKRIIRGTNDGHIIIWNYGEIEKTLIGHSKNIKSLKLLPDRRLISNSIDGVIKIWNLESYKCELTFNTNTINSIKILPNGGIITNENNKFVVWK